METRRLPRTTWRLRVFIHRRLFGTRYYPPLCLANTQLPMMINSLSRQNLPQLVGSSIENANRGGYVLHDSPTAAITLVSTGSEVSIAVEAVEILAKKGIDARVVSMPCFEIFDKQPKAYQLQCFPDGAPILSVEAYAVRIIFFSPLHAHVFDTDALARQCRRRWDGRNTLTSSSESTRLEHRRLTRKFTRNSVLPDLVRSPSIPFRFPSSLSLLLCTVVFDADDDDDVTEQISRSSLRKSSISTRRPVTRSLHRSTRLCRSRGIHV